MRIGFLARIYEIWLGYRDLLLPWPFFFDILFFPSIDNTYTGFIRQRSSYHILYRHRIMVSEMVEICFRGHFKNDFFEVYHSMEE